MKIGLAIRMHDFLERWLPERRVFLRSETDTRFVRLRPHTQLIGLIGVGAVVGWTIIATAILLMDSIGSGNFREQAKRNQANYELRLNELSSERDQRAEEALAAQNRFNSALRQISSMQSQLLASENRRRELETGIEVIQATLRRTMSEREDLATEIAALRETRTEDEATRHARAAAAAEGTLDLVTAALADTAKERDLVLDNAETALAQAEEMQLELRLAEEQSDHIFRQLEEAMTISVEPLDKMFRKAGLDTDRLIREVRGGYSGQGGPLMPISISTRGDADTVETDRANRLLNQMDRLNLYRIAAESAPFAIPVKSAFRFTSGYGMRWGRMHNGTDLAGRHGTAIQATADGVVVHAGWLAGYGKLVKIKHEFGIETRYAHLSKIRVKVGQRVSRGERIGDMGNTGRSTGTHLHYEVRVNGKAVNPMIFIKAARDVF